jgi:hypothetical protein
MDSGVINMEIKDAQYSKNMAGENGSIQANINGKDMIVPLVAGNTEYDEIMKQVKAGTLTIKDAD